MIKKLLALALAFAMSAVAAAPTQFFVEGSTAYEQQRVIRLENTLKFSNEPMVSTWEVTIWSGEEFNRYVDEHNINTRFAFTYLGLNHTFLNEDQLVWHNDAFVRWALAHEAGHMICNCTSEERANEIAVQLGASLPSPNGF